VDGRAYAPSFTRTCNAFSTSTSATGRPTIRPTKQRRWSSTGGVSITGTLKDWDITDRLAEIDVPTLVTSGRHDEATPRIAEVVHRGIRGSEWVVVEESGHLAFQERRGRYVSVLDDFLARVERG